MPDIEAGSLPAASSASNTDKIVVTQGTTTRNATVDQVIAVHEGEHDHGTFVTATQLATHHGASSTDHDDRYYTEAEVDSALSGKANTSHGHTSGDVSDFGEAVRDTVGTALVAGSNVTITVNDPGDTITIAASGGAAPVDSVNGQTGVVVLDADDIDDTATTNKFATAAELSKLAGIEAGADVTDAANVDGAGAVMNSDTSTAAMSFVVDEDSMVSDSNTKVPTQQSVKAYVDAHLNDATDAHDASAISFVAGGTISATTVQTAIEEVNNEKQPLNDILTDLAGLTQAANKLPYFDGATTAAVTDLSAFGRSLIDDADAATARTTLGAAASSHAHALDDLSDVVITTPSNGQVLKYDGANWINDTDATGGGGGALDDLTDVAITAAATGDLLRFNGTNWVDYADSNFAAAGHNHDAAYQPLDDQLTDFAALTQAADRLPYFDSPTTMAVATFTAAGRALLDDADAAAQRTTLGLGTMATAAAADYLAKVAAGAAVENLGAVEFNVNTVGTSGSTETLDTSVYSVHDITMDQACTFTFSNPAPSGKLTEFILILRGAFTPTFPAAVDWPDGSAPTYTTPSIYAFSTVNAGTVWFGRQIGKAYA